MLSCGASVTIVIPAAFVSLYAQAVKRCSARGRLRITASGPFHNLVVWATIALCGHLGIGTLLMSLTGFEYIGHFGRAITDINIVSRQVTPL